MIKVTNIQATRLIGALLILLSGNAFAVTYATQPALNTDISNRKAADTTEKTRATTAEGALKAADTTEKTRATTAEGALKAADTTEKTRATTAEGTLRAADTTEVTARDTAIVSAIASEVTNRNTAIAAETARAIASEAAAGSFSYSMTCGVGGTDACKIGAVGPGGGWIFYVDLYGQYPGFTYLEAAPTDIAAVPWCNIDTSIASEGWAGKAVGKGKANTTAMLGVCSSGAANAADLYFTNTKSDWFIPSQGELKLMYDNLLEAGVGDFRNSQYWSSTESGSYFACYQRFYDGPQYFNHKLNRADVRAVRAF